MHHVRGRIDSRDLMRPHQIEERLQKRRFAHQRQFCPWRRPVGGIAGVARRRHHRLAPLQRLLQICPAVGRGDGEHQGNRHIVHPVAQSPEPSRIGVLRSGWTGTVIRRRPAQCSCAAKACPLRTSDSDGARDTEYPSLRHFAVPLRRAAYNARTGAASDLSRPDCWSGRAERPMGWSSSVRVRGSIV